jgi:hypothetical protein
MVLGVPVQFDLDLGEVFSNELCEDGKPQHRSPEDLEAALKDDFPDVKYIRDDSNKLQIRGRQPEFPESLESARLRFCHKVQELARKAAAKLCSIVLVTHADSLAAVTSLLKTAWILKSIPYTAYIVASRQVKVFDKRTNKQLSEEPVYGHGTKWDVTLGPGMVCEVDPDVKDKRRRDRKCLEDSEEDLQNGQSKNSLNQIGKRSGSPKKDWLVQQLLTHGSSQKEAGELVDMFRRTVTLEQAWKDTHAESTAHEEEHALVSVEAVAAATEKVGVVAQI